MHVDTQLTKAHPTMSYISSSRRLLDDDRDAERVNSGLIGVVEASVLTSFPYTRQYITMLRPLDNKLVTVDKATRNQAGSNLTK